MLQNDIRALKQVVDDMRVIVLILTESKLVTSSFEIRYTIQCLHSRLS